MKNCRPKFQFLFFLALILLLVTQLAVAQTSRRSGQTQPSSKERSTSPRKKEAGRFVSIDFNDVDINVFIKFISELTGSNFVVDNRVKGKVTIISPSKISIKEAYKVFESVLEVHGFATVRAGEVTKIVPSPDARTKNIETKLREERDSPEDKVVTQLVPLRYADPDQIKRLFTPMVSKSSVILSYAPTNTLIITDVYSNIKRLIKILNSIDIPGIGREISVIPLNYADANKLVNTLGSVFKPVRIKGKQSLTAEPVTFVADERTNTIILLASEVETIKIRQLIDMLDKETPRDKGKIRVYYLEYATAEELAAVLSELPTKDAASAAKGKRTAPVVSEKVRITADKATNSLIITADSDDYQVIEEIIKKLDIPRGMVYIEALIMEVTVGKEFDLGVNWSVIGEINVDGKNTALGGGFPSVNTTDPTAALLPGFNLGLITEPVTIAGFTVSNITAFVEALQTNDDFQILSTPQILTSDNEEARIVIADNLAFQTRSSTATSGDTFNSFEYRDVGKILSITPHISKGRQVRLKISLEVSNVIDNQDNRPETRKRNVDTTVIVKDNHTVVIGGLIDDSITDSETKIPCLGDVPGLSWLFRSISTDVDKTNLYIFITPRVIQSPEEADEVFRRKKGQIDSVRGGQIKMYQNGIQQLEPDDSTMILPGAESGTPVLPGIPEQP
jgi:general secretion pathway protein D